MWISSEVEVTMKYGKRLFLFLFGVLFLVTFFCSSLASAATVRNISNQSLMINLSGGRMLHLTPGQTAQVSSNDLASAHIQSLLEAGYISVTQTPAPQPKKQPEVKKKKTLNLNQ